LNAIHGRTVYTQRPDRRSLNAANQFPCSAKSVAPAENGSKGRIGTSIRAGGA
jgi:hypothetical protein